MSPITTTLASSLISERTYDKLLVSRAFAQRQVQQHHQHFGAGETETHDDGAAARERARQFVVFERARLQPRQQPIAVLCDRTEVAVQLRVPVRKVAAIREVFDLVDEAAAQAAGIDLLQRDDVVVRNEITDQPQVVGARLVRQQMLPAVRQVVAISAGADADLNVEAEQT